MKVLMVTNIYPKSDFPGQGSFIHSQVQSIINEGIGVDLISINAKKNRWNYLKALFKIYQKSISQDYDLIHAHYGYSGMISRMQFKYPVLVSYCGGDILGSPTQNGKRTLESKFDILLGKILSLTVPAVIVKSKEMASRLPKRENVFVIPNGVNMKIFKPIPRRAARKILKLDPEKKYILFPANPNWPRKCFQVANKAVEMLKANGHDVEILVLHSKSPEMVPLYMNASNAVVMTSYWEGSPNVIKEAMACNVPIVSVNVGDVRNVIGDCPGCYIVERKSTDIADKLDFIIRTVDRTEGRSFIQHLEIQKVAKRIIHIYNKLSLNSNGKYN